MRSHLEKHGIHVELGAELVGFEQTKDEVVAHIVKRQGSEETRETFTASWLIGADGGKSTSPVAAHRACIDFD